MFPPVGPPWALPAVSRMFPPLVLGKAKVCPPSTSSVAASPALPNTWQVVLQVPGGGVGYEALLNTIAPSAVPTPYATPSFASPIYETSGLTSALPSATTVTVLLNNTASNCNSYPAVGSFTTQ